MLLVNRSCEVLASTLLVAVALVAAPGVSCAQEEVRSNGPARFEERPSVETAARAPRVHTIPLFLPASHVGQEGFARIINLSGQAGTVRIQAIDDTGARFGPVSLALEAMATAHFNSRDLERGNTSKGLSGGVGSGEGNWWLELETKLEIEALSYIRTADGFLTSMHDVADAASLRHHVVTFNPGNDRCLHI